MLQTIFRIMTYFLLKLRVPLRIARTAVILVSQVRVGLTREPLRPVPSRAPYLVCPQGEQTVLWSQALQHDLGLQITQDQQVEICKIRQVCDIYSCVQVSIDIIKEGTIFLPFKRPPLIIAIEQNDKRRFYFYSWDNLLDNTGIFSTVHGPFTIHMDFILLRFVTSIKFAIKSYLSISFFALLFCQFLTSPRRILVSFMIRNYIFKDSSIFRILFVKEATYFYRFNPVLMNVTKASSSPIGILQKFFKLYFQLMPNLSKASLYEQLVANIQRNLYQSQEFLTQFVISKYFLISCISFLSIKCQKSNKESNLRLQVTLKYKRFLFGLSIIVI